MPKLSRSRFLFLLLLSRCVRPDADCGAPDADAWQTGLGGRRLFRRPAACPSPPAPSGEPPDPFPRGDVA